MNDNDTDTDFFAVVRDSLVSALEIDAGAVRLDAGTQLLELPNMNSLAMMRTLSLIEMRLGIELDDDELVAARTVGELAEVVRLRHASGRS